MKTNEFRPGLYTVRIARTKHDRYTNRDDYTEGMELVFADWPEDLEDDSFCGEPQFVCEYTNFTVVIYDEADHIAYISDRYDRLEDALRILGPDEEAWDDENGIHTWREAFATVDDSSLADTTQGLLKFLTVDYLDRAYPLDGVVVCDSVK